MAGIGKIKLGTQRYIYGKGELQESVEAVLEGFQKLKTLDTYIITSRMTFSFPLKCNLRPDRQLKVTFFKTN